MPMTTKSARLPKLLRFSDWLDVLAISTWGVLLLKYWLTGKLGLLVHPRYFWLIIATGFVLLLIAALKTWELLQKPLYVKQQVQHLTLFPPGWSSGLLLLTALLGFLIAPQPLTSSAAVQQGLADSLISTRTQPQTFRSSKKSEEKSLVDWARTLAVYPEPDNYIGQKVKVQGFAVHLPELPDSYLIISRFVIAHCALDAYPVGFPVQLTSSRQAYPPDTWLEIEGQMITAELQGKRQLAIQAQSLKPISEPKDPYQY